VNTIFAQLNNAAILWADSTASSTPSGGAGNGENSMMLLQSMLPFVAIFVLFYFLLIRPQKREQSRRRDMLAAVKKNDRVLTAGGVYGIVTNVRPDADEVTIKVDESTNTKLRMTLSSVTRVMSDEPTSENPSNN
jgi:preprotein translocase subunit YajC